ncbi:hypothetical protein C8T65DRAFT_827875 [Cerioporus squamosus]|nr:hypothetical protein C8T65DRAFT_827875 [Cerioporus squamosus]
MPPRPTLPSPAGSFYPPNDIATHRDLLLFEERLKMNAAALHRRKRRYQLFLLQLLIISAFLLCEVVLQTNMLSYPYKWVLHQVLPDIYPEDADVRVHPYFASGLLFVSVTTLVLFFASGMYSEKISYANRYVPHANRALRSFNMYLNMRQPPLRSKLPFNPFAFLFARPPPPTSPISPTSPHSPRRRSPSPSPGGSRRSSSVPIPPIPPASNPRGELIFSSRVDRGFASPTTATAPNSSVAEKSASAQPPRGIVAPTRIRLWDVDARGQHPVARARARLGQPSGVAELSGGGGTPPAHPLAGESVKGADT